MVYAVTYVKVDAETVVDIGVGSDDSYHVLVNGVTPAIYGLQNVARGWGVANEVQSIVEDVVLEPGCNIIMIKVFERGGTASVSASVMTGNPIIPGPIFTNPECPAVAAAPGSVAADPTPPAISTSRTASSSSTTSSWAVRSPVPGCRGLGRQRPAQHHGRRPHPQLPVPRRPAPPAPGPDSCGPDPTSDDDLPTCVYTAC